MNKRIFVLIASLMIATPITSRAEDAPRVHRIGVLTELSEQGVQAWKMVLRNRGYIEGQNTSYVFRAANGRFDLLPKLASELIQA